MLKCNIGGLASSYIQIIIQVATTLQVTVKIAQLEAPLGHIIPNNCKVFDLRPFSTLDLLGQILQ